MTTMPALRRLLATASCVPALALATPPTINSVSGTMQSGQALTITGANMLNEDRTNWDPFFLKNVNASSFEGTNPAADGYSAPGSPTGGTYDSAVGLLGNKSMRFRAEGASGSCPGGNLTDYNSIDPAGGDGNEYWIRLYARWRLNGGGWPSSHIKMIDSQGSPSFLQLYFQPVATGGPRPTAFDAVHDGISHHVAIPSGQLQDNRWYGIELHWKSSGANLYEAWIDGVQVYSANPVNEPTLEWIMMGLINLCGTNASFSLDHWWDGFAVSTSRVRLASIIEIGNSPDYATATKVYQAPDRLSETSSQIKVNLSGLGSGPYYLWVTNNRGERSLPFGLSGSTTLPPPGNLRVQ
jgi:hypothetical protein